jgi:hypothetical protein
MEQVETVFTVGLLHDLGIVLLDPFVQELRLEFKRAVRKPGKIVSSRWKKRFLGMDHASGRCENTSKLETEPRNRGGCKMAP